MNELQIELQDPEYNGMTAAEALVYGNQTTTTVIQVEPYSWSGVYAFCEAKGLSVGVVGPIIKSLPNGEGDAMNDMLLSGKFDFSLPANRVKIQALVDANISPDHTAVANALLAIAEKTENRWQAIGIAEPTLEDVQKAQIVNATSKTMTDTLAPVAAKNTALQGWLQALDTTTMTATEVKTYCDDLLASSDGNPTGGA